jgi:hypothetical protein
MYCLDSQISGGGEAVGWDQLVAALRNELQEKGGLIRLLNQQTELLFRRNIEENDKIEEAIRQQSRLTMRCTQERDFILRQIAAAMQLPENVETKQVLQRFPEYVQPLLEALFSEVDRLSGRVEDRLRQNETLKERFLAEPVETI